MLVLPGLGKHNHSFIPQTSEYHQYTKYWTPGATSMKIKKFSPISNVWPPYWFVLCWYLVLLSSFHTDWIRPQPACTTKCNILSSVLKTWKNCRKIVITEFFSAMRILRSSFPARQYFSLCSPICSLKNPWWLSTFLNFTPSSFFTLKTDFKYKVLMDSTSDLRFPGCHQPPVFPCIPQVSWVHRPFCLLSLPLV